MLCGVVCGTGIDTGRAWAAGEDYRAGLFFLGILYKEYLSINSDLTKILI